MKVDYESMYYQMSVRVDDAVRLIKMLLAHLKQTLREGEDAYIKGHFEEESPEE
jgi:hypothetical protein